MERCCAGKRPEHSGTSKCLPGLWVCFLLLWMLHCLCHLRENRESRLHAPLLLLYRGDLWVENALSQMGQGAEHTKSTLQLAVEPTKAPINKVTLVSFPIVSSSISVEFAHPSHQENRWDHELWASIHRTKTFKCLPSPKLHSIPKGFQ